VPQPRTGKDNPAAKLKDELPHIVQVYPSDHDTIIMAAEIERLREALGVAKMWSDKDWVGYEIVCKALAGKAEQ